MLVGQQMAFGSLPQRMAPPGQRMDAPVTQRSPKAVDIVLKPPKFGVVIFNNPSSPTSGVACCEGQRPIPFSARTELPSDTIWISDAYFASGAQNFRSSDFLRCTPKQIGDDLGVDVRDPVDGLPVVAECIARVRDMAAHAYPWMDMSVDWSDKTLGKAIAKVCKLTGESTVLPESVQSALKLAYQGYSSIPDRNALSSQPGGGKIMTLRANRLRYAHYICSQTYPCGEWRALSRKTLLSSPIDAFLDPAKPVVVEATVEFLDRDSDAVSSSLVAFGSSGSNRPTLRTWISQPELAWLLGHANVHISAALVCDRAEPLPERLRLPRVLTADPVYALSVAAGVLAECHWAGLAAETQVRKPGPSATSIWTAEVTPYAVWMKAFDRAYTFQMALAAYKKGYAVTGYGYGALSLWVPKDALGDLAEFAEGIGTCHPNLGAMIEREMIGFSE